MGSAMRVLTVVLGISIAGCATSFSPERVRGEIAAQTGQDPRCVFEIQLGRVTMHMIRAGLPGGGSALPLAGLNEFDLAVYDVPGAVAHNHALEALMVASGRAVPRRAGRVLPRVRSSRRASRRWSAPPTNGGA
jgi:hypothetical protein